MQPTELVGMPEVVCVQNPGAVCRSTRARLRKRSTGSGDHSSSAWKYKTGMYSASRAERCAGVTLFSRRDAASAAATHKTTANPSATRMTRHLVRDFDIDASVAGRPWQRRVVQRLRTCDCPVHSRDRLAAAGQHRQANHGNQVTDQRAAGTRNPNMPAGPRTFAVSREPTGITPSQTEILDREQTCARAWEPGTGGAPDQLLTTQAIPAAARARP